MNVAKIIPFKKNDSTIKFIVRESKQQTIYAGDRHNKKLIVISKNAPQPIYFDMKFEPNRGLLMNNDAKLIVSCLAGQIIEFDLSNTSLP